MNANELADLLISTKFQVDEDGTMIGVSHQAVDEAATMLRQLQAENEVLKFQNDNYWVMIEILRQKVKAQEK